MSLRSLSLLAIAAGLPGMLAAEDTSPPPTVPELLRRIDNLDQRVRILDRKAELAADADADRTRSAVRATAGSDGFALTSGDGQYRLRLGLLLQIDGRFWLNDGDAGQAVQPANTFLIRRGQPTLDAQLGRFTTARFQANFTSASSVGLTEAWVKIQPVDALGLQAGRFKTIGREYSDSSAGLTFIERGLPTNLVPQYDVGAALGGKFGRIGTWRVGLVNGAPDGSTRDTDTDDDKDGFAAVDITPFAGDPDGPLSGLSLSLGATSGYETGVGTAGNQSLTSGYKSPGQLTVFSYAASTYAHGRRERLAPALAWYGGPVGVLAEYGRSSQQVARASRTGTVTASAWQATVSYVLTGEAKRSAGVVPRRAFDPANDGWGAWEIAARAGQLRIADDAFDGTTADRFADPTTAVRQATDLGLAVNWWLDRHLKWQIAYDYTRFDGGGGGSAADPIARQSEQVFISRIQIAY